MERGKKIQNDRRMTTTGFPLARDTDLQEPVDACGPSSDFVGQSTDAVSIHTSSGLGLLR
uniref:Uncharacterized protein n=1 Tax=Salix viminalis TaxID=40686 RepID=A0A6N2JZ14_SALVM